MRWVKVFHHKFSTNQNKFLIWGNIEPEAIIGVFSKLDLLEYSWTYPKLREVLRLNTLQEVTTASEYKKVLKNTVVKMDETTGYSLGHFLGCIVKLPLSRLESAALLFAKSLKFKGNNSLQSTFLAGAKAGYHAYLYQLFPSENLPSVAVVINRSTKPWKVPGNNFDDFLKSRKRIEDILSLGHYWVLARLFVICMRYYLLTLTVTLSFPQDQQAGQDIYHALIPVSTHHICHTALRVIVSYQNASGEFHSYSKFFSVSTVSRSCLRQNKRLWEIFLQSPSLLLAAVKKMTVVRPRMSEMHQVLFLSQGIGDAGLGARPCMFSPTRKQPVQSSLVHLILCTPLYSSGPSFR